MVRAAAALLAGPRSRMTRSIRCLPWIFLLLLLFLAGAGRPLCAMQVRVYDPARHDRFTGFPAAPVWNDAAWFGSRRFAGVGWRASDPLNHRQVALVSPVHAVCATHFAPSPGDVLRFLNQDGLVVERSVAARFTVRDGLAQESDLCLLRLGAPILAEDKVPPFPYLNLTGEAAYLNTALVAFGTPVRAGRGRIAAFEDLDLAGIGQTRVMRFDYVKLTGNRDDCYLQVGDSGSPSFALVDGHPALVGTHSAADEDLLKRYAYDAFVPHYLDDLDALMAAEGYRMAPVQPPPVALAVASQADPEPWRQARPASLAITITNTSPNPATNVAVVLRFPAERMPDAVAAPGWIGGPGLPGEWRLRRAGLAAGAASPVSASWADTGLSNELGVVMELRADGLAEQSHDLGRPLAPSYLAWAAGLDEPEPEADGDGDGVPNLLEYAFGGDPAAASRRGPGGHSLLPSVTPSAGWVSARFPVRGDAALRGLAYVPEFSADPAAGGWSEEPPPGFTTADTPLDPPVAGFLLRTLGFPATGPRCFVRVRVEWDEDG
jgi:hypothetical protein